MGGKGPRQSTKCIYSFRKDSVSLSLTICQRLLRRYLVEARNEDGTMVVKNDE